MSLLTKYGIMALVVLAVMYVTFRVDAIKNVIVPASK
jgi:hypothetical protein